MDDTAISRPPLTRSRPTHNVTAVRPAHGGFPDPGTLTVNQRLAAFLRQTDAIVHVGPMPAGSDEGDFLATTHLSGSTARPFYYGYGPDPLAAVDAMLAEVGR